MNLIIYTKPDCHLCDVMKEKILKLKESYEFDLSEINILEDKDYELYKEKIPVLFINGRIFAKFTLDPDKLIKRLSDNEMNSL